MSLVSLAFHNFDPGQPMPGNFPHRGALAYAACAFMLIAGGALEWRRTLVCGAAMLTAYYTFVVVLMMNGRIVLAHYAEFGAYSGTAEQLAIAAAGLVLFATNANIAAAAAARVTRVGQATFGVCALSFGGAHFFYMNLTAPLVPTWLPPSQEFWGYATGLAHIAAGVAILVGIQARLAAILLTIMYGSFTVLVHVPTLMVDPSSRANWSENALNLALIGVAWVIADSLKEPQHSHM